MDGMITPGYFGHSNNGHGNCQWIGGKAALVRLLCQFGTKRMKILEASTLAVPAKADASTTARFEVLDSWRGLCALLVALFHFPATGWLVENDFIRGSYLFVDFFFVLSGFVIAHAYSERLSDGASFKRFMLTRFGRLFPLHFFMLAAFVLYEMARAAFGQETFSGGNTISSLLSNLFMLHGLGVENSLTWNAPSWSISTELFAYLLFGLLTLALGRTALLAFASAVIVAPLFLFAVSPDYMDATHDFGFIRCLYGFATGVLVQAAFVQVAEKPTPDMETRLTWTFTEGAVVLAVGLFVATSFAGPFSLAAPFVFALAVFVFAHEAGYVSRLLRAPIFLSLGALSYSIYMTHLFIQGRMLNAGKLVEKLTGLNMLTADAGGAPVFVAAWALPMAGLMLAVVIAASWLTYRYVEVPGRDWFRKLAQRIR
jgi:peptidoglycan/LPS O-acetylase OafA/YrhL